MVFETTPPNESLKAKAPIKENFSQKPISKSFSSKQTFPVRIMNASFDIIQRGFKLPVRPSDIAEKLRRRTASRILRDHKLFAVYDRALFHQPRDCA